MNITQQMVVLVLQSIKIIGAKGLKVNQCEFFMKIMGF